MRPFITIILLVIGAAGAVAQETTGDIRGRLESGEGAPVVAATVTASGPNLLGTRTTRSASDGVFQFLGLPPGLYTLRVNRIGFAVLFIDSVRVRLGKTEGLGSYELRPAAAQLTEVRIAAPSVTLDPARTTIGATLEASELAAHPGERDYKSAIATLPHVNTSYHGDPVNVGGSTGLENMYFIDGANVTDPLKGAGGTTLPSNFVRSVEVRAGGYEARYGRALGAIVNAVTYTGTNEFESSIFGYFTNDGLALAPRALPTLRETASSSYDIGARLSGPVVRDRLWFSAAYNPRIAEADRTIQGHGSFVDRRRTDIFAGKLTWLPSPAHEIALSVFGDPTTHDQVEEVALFSGLTPVTPDPFRQQLKEGTTTVSARATATITPRLLIESAVSRSVGKRRQQPMTVRGRSTRFYIDFVNDSIDGGFGYPDITNHHRTSALVHATLSAANHTVVLGAEYEDANVFRAVEMPGGGVIERRDTNLYVINTEQAAGTFHNRTPTAFAQDAWRMTDRLTVNLGVRWSRQLLTAASGATAQTFEDEWQPRVGFSLQVGSGSTQRVFGSFGRFYQQEPLNLSSLWYVDYYQTSAFHSRDPRQAGVTPDSVITGSTPESDIVKQIDGIEVENFDEITLGYERLLARARLTLRGVHRTLRSTFGWGFNFAADPAWVLGTPGEGNFDFLPRPKRDYSALEVGLDGQWLGASYRASYVWSRTWGNYSGFFVSDLYLGSPGGNFTLFMPHQAVNSTGLLPNDRTHVLKLATSYRIAPAVTSGLFATWQSGTPLNEFGAHAGGPLPPAFVVRRGSAGRTPSILDVNLRVVSDGHRIGRSTARVILDVMHLGNPRTAVRFDQQRYETLDDQGNQASPNAKYGQPTAYMPPMMARLGFEIGR